MTKELSTTIESENQLVKVYETVINGESIDSVDARELWVFLESKQEFATWIKNRLEKYGFLQGIDFISFDNSVKAEATYINTKEYTLTIDTAKELAMVENNSKGREARKYFIECEKRLKRQNIKDKPVLTMSMAEELKAAYKIVEFFGITGNQAKLSANTAVKKLHGIDCMNLLGITGFIEETQTQYLTPTVLGKPRGLSAVKMNQALEAAGLQTHTRDHKKRIVWKVTKKGTKYCQIIDTNKKLIITDFGKSF